MWTDENRKDYERKGLRYPSDMTDAEWALIAPLIPREDIFGNPSRSAGMISPDGRWVSWLAPRDGVMNVWVAPAASPDQARPLTRETSRGLRQYFWAPDSGSLLYVQDKGGDENFLLYGVEVATAKQRALTPFEKTRVEIVAIRHVVRKDFGAELP